MSSNDNQHDLANMFQDWIQKSGYAQAEFVRKFGSMMNQGQQPFDPLKTLKEISENATNVQFDMMKNMQMMQNKGMGAMFDIGSALSSFTNWGAYKTTIGSNGRISIPEAERNALGLEEGDLVQVVVLPIAKRSQEVKE